MRQESLGIKRIGILAAASVAVALALLFLQPLFADAAIRFLLACLFQLLPLALAGYAMVRVARHWMRDLTLDQRDRRRIALITLLFAAAGVLFIYFFFRTEKDIKTYDHSAYWIRVIEDREVISGSIWDYLVRVRNSLPEEYNYVAAFPLLLISYVTGLSYGGFVQSVLIAYYIPACFFLTLFALRVNKLRSGRKPGAAMFAFCFAIASLSVCMLAPVLDGYIEVSCVLFMALLLNVTMRWDICAFDWKKNIAIALLCLSMVLLKRWFVVYALGFLASFALVAVFGMLRGRELTWKRVSRLLLNLLMILATSAALMLLLNPALLSSLFGRSDAAAYSAFGRVGALESLLRFIRSNGIFWLLMSMAGMIVLLRARATRTITLRLLVAMVLSVGAFSLMRNMEYHHYYLAVPTLILFACGAAEFAAQYAITQEKPILVLAILFLCGINFPLSFAKPLEAFSWITEPFTTSLHKYPQQRPSYDVARLVASDLAPLSAGQPRYTYVVGDQPLSNEVIRRSYLPEVVDAAPYMLHQQVIDLRDGFPSKAFFAEYLLVNKPYQSDFSEYQQVNYQLYDLLVNDPLAEKYYSVDSVYPTHLGESVLYKKKRPTDTAIVNALSERLRAYYPENAFIYAPNHFIALMEVLGDTDFAFDQWSLNFTFEKAKGEPVSFRINDTADFTALTFDLVSDVPGLSLTVENQDGVLSTAQIARMGGETFAFDIAGSDFITVTIAEDAASAPIETTLRLNSTFESLS